MSNKWYNLTTEELKAVVNGPENTGIKGSLMTFMVVFVNIAPLVIRHPLKFTKIYINAVFDNFIKN